MKIVRFKADRRIEYGVLKGDSVRAIIGSPFRGLKITDRRYDLNAVKLLPPCQPSKIVALGVNYHSHAKDFFQGVPKLPLIFLKPSTSVVGPEENIVYPPSSQKVDYEAELGVVIGKTAKRVTREKALDYVLGYTCVNDVTARDEQKEDGQWTRGKGYDTFAPIGPCIETELDPGDVILESYLNGELRQHGTTRDLVFPVPELISFISGVMTLLPGDIIATGTPFGVGPMLPYDTIEIKIPQIGTLRNYVVKGDYN